MIVYPTSRKATWGLKQNLAYYSPEYMDLNPAEQAGFSFDYSGEELSFFAKQRLILASRVCGLAPPNRCSLPFYRT